MNLSIETPLKPLTGLLSEGDNDNKFRYYHCVLNSSGCYSCEKKKYVTAPESEKVSQLLSIPKAIPEILDPLIIKYQLIPQVKVVGK